MLIWTTHWPINSEESIYRVNKNEMRWEGCQPLLFCTMLQTAQSEVRIFNGDYVFPSIFIYLHSSVNLSAFFISLQLLLLDISTKLGDWDAVRVSEGLQMVIWFAVNAQNLLLVLPSFSLKNKPLQQNKKMNTIWYLWDFSVQCCHGRFVVVSALLLHSSELFRQMIHLFSSLFSAVCIQHTKLSLIHVVWDVWITCSCLSTHCYWAVSWQWTSVGCRPGTAAVCCWSTQPASDSGPQFLLFAGTASKTFCNWKV